MSVALLRAVFTPSVPPRSRRLVLAWTKSKKREKHSDASVFWVLAPHSNSNVLTLCGIYLYMVIFRYRRFSLAASHVITICSFIPCTSWIFSPWRCIVTLMFISVTAPGFGQWVHKDEQYERRVTLFAAHLRADPRANNIEKRQRWL